MDGDPRNAKEHPILFTGEMIRAIQRGDKAQTRRVVKFRKGVAPNVVRWTLCADDLWVAVGVQGDMDARDWKGIKCPYGVPGDRLWVRENLRFNPNHRAIYYEADQAEIRKGVYERICREQKSIREYIPSIHMPRHASRITPEVTSIRLERVQEISIDDILAEGVPPIACDEDGSELYEAFSDLWDSINAKRGYGWDVNPWVWVVDFQKEGQQ